MMSDILVKVPMVFSPKDDVEGLFSSIGISLLCHLVVLLLFLFSPFRPARLDFSSSAINVDLISVSSPGSNKPSQPKQQQTIKEAPKEVPPPPPQPVAAEAPPEIKEKVIIPTEPKEKVSLKKKTFQADKIKEQAIERIEKNLANTKPSAFEKALERLQEKVAETPHREWEGNGDEGGGVSGPSMGNQQMSPQLSIYLAEINYRIKKNWAFPKQLSGGDKNLEVVLSIKILSNGEIQEIEVEKKS